ncbi:MAG: lipopolysaccharide biosynthesis protein [Patescibacteria group bacterium]
MDRIVSVLKNPKSKDIAVNSFGNYLNIFFVALLQPILFRILTPEEYAVFGVLTTIAYLLTNIMDFGTPAAIYSYLPPLLVPKMRRQMFTFIKTTFYFLTLFASIVVVLLFVTFDFFDTIFFKTDASWIAFLFASLMVLFLVWQNFLINTFFAAKQFFKANVALNLSNAIRTLGILILIVTDMVSVTSLIIMLGVVGPFSFYAILLRGKHDQVRRALKAPVNRSEFRFRYTLTYFMSTQFLNVGLRADLFLLSFFRDVITKTELGYYAAAQKIVLTLLTAIISITQVLSPGFSQVKTQADARKEMKHGFLYMLFPVALFLGVFITPDVVYRLFFGADFFESTKIAKMIALPFTIYAMASVPMLFLLYSAKKSPIILVAYVVFFLVMSVGCYLLIPVYGILAPPIMLATGFGIAGIILSYFAYGEYRKLPA